MKIYFIILFLMAFQLFAGNYKEIEMLVTDRKEIGNTLLVSRGKMQNGIMLRITYSGYLTKHNFEPIKAFVKVNYSSGSRSYTFPMVRSNDMRTVYRLTLASACLILVLRDNAYSECVKESTIEMKDLLFWGMTNYGRLNALDIEFAFVDEKGNWDSNHGKNYRIQFPQEEFQGHDH